ncbi:MAG: hypothetical protein KBT68_09905 [bacterium]|nr:hypothetical protein [Candidatus Colisoma equi]
MIINEDNMVDAKRFETIAHASVMTSGRLRFATDAMELMNLNDVKSVILFSLNNRRMPDEDIEYAAVTCTEEDKRGFTLKASGPYKYLSLKNFLVAEAINFKDYTTTFEVTEVNERWDGKPVFRLTLRQVPKPAEQARLEKLREEQEAAAEDMPF